MIRLGIVSDTHGLLRPEIFEPLAGCDRILHAGDVGDPEVLEGLRRVAPVEAVRGNTDFGKLANLPSVVEGRAEGITYRVTHRREDAPAAWSREASLVIFGHSHRPEMEWRSSCLWLNPGAIGPRRFSLPLTLAIVTVDGERLVPELRGIFA